MSILLIEIPPRPRLSSRADEGDAASLRPPAEWLYVLSSDGSTVTRSGHAATALLPKADRVVAVLSDADVSWHRITVPRAPTSRQRAALAGVLEEALLDEADAAHIALAPKASAGAAGWVAVTDRAWVAAMLTELESGGLVVDRLVPGAAPADGASGRFRSAGSTDADAPPWLTFCNAQGVIHLRLAGTLARSLVGSETTVQWSATPAAAAAAERWLGSPVVVRSDAEQLLRAAASPWNLRQFDLVSRHRGTRALRTAARRFFGPEWRAARWGLVALAALHLVGINAWAWQQSQALKHRRAAMGELLRSTHPQVRAVLDAPLQMQREVEALRAAAGRPGDADLERLLAAAASHWPEGIAPVQNLRFEPGKLILGAPGFGQQHLAPLRERLLALGFDAEWSEGRITILRADGRKPG